MPNLFGVDIAAEINNAIGNDLLDVIVVQVEHAERTTGRLTAGKEVSETPYAGKGFVEEYSDFQVDGTLIKRGDKKAIVLGGSLSIVPKSGYKLTIEDVTHEIINVKRDPAGATYTCQIRG